MDPQRPLTSLSGKSIFGFLSLEKRQSLSKKCPATRKWQRTLPFCFKKVVLSNECVEIENFKWKFDFFHKYDPEDSADEEANNNCPTKKFIADEQIPLTVTFPSGKKFFLDNPDQELARALIEYYINRKGSRIRLLEVQTYWENMQDLVGVNVSELTLLNVFHREYREKFMNSFKNNKFEKVWIYGNGEDETLVEQLKGMNIKHLQLNFRSMADPTIQELDFERIVLMEGDFAMSSLDGQLFVERITPYLARSYDKTFGYMLNFFNTPNFDPKVIVNSIRKRWGAKHKYDFYQGALVIDINDVLEVRITCYLGQLGPWTGGYIVDSVALAMTIMEKQNLVPASKLSTYGRILRRMHIWQYSVTEFLKESYQLEDYCHEHKRFRECLFFLNNYYLRSITFLIFFCFYCLVFSVLSILGFPLGAPLSFLASLVLASIVNFSFLLPYQYDCRKPAVWDIAEE